MALSANSLAAAVGASATNSQFTPAAQDVERKILIIGSYDPAKTGVTPDVPAQILSPEACGATYGFGSMVHRLAIACWKGSNGVKTYVSPQAESIGAAAATGNIAFTGPSTAAGTIYLYIAGDQVQVNIASGATVEQITDACVAAITADANLPVTAAKRAVTFELDLTAKTQGTYGNKISIALNLNTGEALPTGVGAVITGMSGGTGTPDITTALNATGIADNSNEAFYTDVVHGYLLDTTTLDAISTYVGPGNTATGLWSKTISRPFRALTGDTTAGAAGLAALVAIGALRKEDRANGVIAVPDSPNHPSEIAAQAIGICAAANVDVAGAAYIGKTLVGVYPGDQGTDRWTSEYDNRDTAVKAGISPTLVKSGLVKLQNVVTFYHPDNVPTASNGYRDFEDISKLQNILYSLRLNFEADPWPGALIVADVTKVDAINRSRAKDISSVIDALVTLASAFEAKAWIYSAKFTTNILSVDPLSVTIRPGGTGFNIIFPVQLSGNAAIIDNVVEFDTAIS